MRFRRAGEAKLQASFDELIAVRLSARHDRTRRPSRGSGRPVGSAHPCGSLHDALFWQVVRAEDPALAAEQARKTAANSRYEARRRGWLTQLLTVAAGKGAPVAVEVPPRGLDHSPFRAPL